jgi:two-component system CheB/CheR fusion protein
VVVIFTHIGALKQLEQEQREARLSSRAILETLSDPVVVLDHSLRVVSHNKGLLTLLGLDGADAAGERLYDPGAGQFDQPEFIQPEFISRLRDVGRGAGNLSGFLLEMDLPGRGREVVKLNARQPVHPDGADESSDLLLLWGEDVTPILRQLAERGADAVHDAASAELP